MVLTVSLLLAYQCLQGTMYRAVGALAAAFMAGFAAGSFGALVILKSALRGSADPAASAWKPR